MPTQDSPSDCWGQRIQDAIATNSKIRDGLHDAEAIPLVEWGNTYAAHLGTRLAAPDTPPPDQEQVDNAAYALARLLTRINWLVSYRRKKDAAWLSRTFQTVNDLSRELLGDDAPMFSDEEIAAWIAAHETHADAELIQGLIARLAPSAPEFAAGPGAEDTPPPGTPASPELPDMTDTFDQSGPTDSPSRPGDTLL